MPRPSLLPVVLAFAAGAPATARDRAAEPPWVEVEITVHADRPRKLT
jgi:hypothetical protein